MDKMTIQVICTKKNCYWEISTKNHWWEIGKRNICNHREPKLNLAGNSGNCSSYISRIEAQRKLLQLKSLTGGR